ncbi:MAG TPA: hypothetical protein PKO34_04490 [Smithellaceae bacterium]|nr:hypothetical protein [Smithellaceae bacterium]
MALKILIGETETDAGAETSEALRGPESGLDHNNLTPGKEDHPKHTENHVHALIILAVREIEQNQNGVQYRLSEELRACESEVNRRAFATLNGASSDFEPLREACARWVDTARKTAEPITAHLFSEV